jgi:hypothetical protein
MDGCRMLFFELFPAFVTLVCAGIGIALLAANYR